MTREKLGPQPDVESTGDELASWKKLPIPLVSRISSDDFDVWADRLLEDYELQLRQKEKLQDILSAYFEGKKQLALGLMRDTSMLPELFWLALEYLVVNPSLAAKGNADLRHLQSNREKALAQAAFRQAKIVNPKLSKTAFAKKFHESRMAEREQVWVVLERNKAKLKALTESTEIANSAAAKSRYQMQTRELETLIMAMEKDRRKVFPEKRIREWLNGL